MFHKFMQEEKPSYIYSMKINVKTPSFFVLSEKSNRSIDQPIKQTRLMNTTHEVYSFLLNFQESDFILLK